MLIRAQNNGHHKQVAIMKLNVDLNILKKYSRPGPRYTSYPTAPHFTPAFGSSDFERVIRESNHNGENGDISLYFHFPFCPQLCYYCGCNVIISRNETRINRYLEYLKKEIQLLRGLIHPDRKVTQLHWGGGTPNYLNPQQIRTIFQAIQEAFDFTADAEISVEIDPRTLTPDHLPLFRELGFNRLSFGVQDFEHQVQVTINRIQPEDMTRRVVEESRALGFPSINVDLIYGLPFQNEATFSRTLDKIVAISPDRLAVFNYAHVPWLKKHQRVIPEEALPSAEVKLRLLKMTIERLTESGYVFIGMDHFARPDDELSIAQQTRTLYRNFQGYSPRAGAEVFALGITSISQLKRIYAQNVKDTRRYEHMLDEGKLPTFQGIALSDDDVLRRHVINELMCNNRVVKADVEKQFHISFDDYFANDLKELKPLEADGLVEMDADEIRVTTQGRFVVRNIAMAFDWYLKHDQMKKNIYSKTI